MTDGAAVVRLVIADDHPIVRRGLRRVMELEPDLAVVGEAGDAEALFDVLAASPADVLLLDVGMPGPGVLPILRRCAAEHAGLRVLVLSVYPEEQYGLRVLRAGGSGYLSKEDSPELVVEAVRRVARGERWLSPALARELDAARARGYVTSRHELLSERELQVLLALGAGRTVGDAAAALGLSPKTVSTYRTRLIEKLGAQSNADLVRYVREHDLRD